MKPSLALRAGQSLTLTPALQQAIKLLQMSSLDLQQEIRSALESNLMLELAEDEDTEPADAALEAPAPAEAATVETAGDSAGEAGEDEAPAPDSGDETPVDVDWDTLEDSSVPAGPQPEDPDEQYEFRQANLHTGTSLHEHLVWQARLAPLNEWQTEVAAYLIDAINDDGYLENFEEACQHFAASMGLSRAQVEQVLHLVQDFDPPGVGARDLTECLRLQLLQLPDDPLREWALTAVNAHMHLLARKDPAALARALALDETRAGDVLALVQSLQPHPGRPYQSAEADYVTPDVIVRKHQGRWKVSLNPDIAPRVRINPYYLGMIKRADSSREQVTLKTHLQEARYFINSLESRNDTLLRVAQCIIEEQRAFLDYGDEAMRPLVLRDIAERLGIHESTVSRATANKYMLTPRGLYELKYFFSSHVQTLSGGTASATAIQAMIKRLITAEPAGQPLSDSQLAEVLLGEGIQVARRTVAKYREGLGIPPSHERRA